MFSEKNSDIYIYINGRIFAIQFHLSKIKFE